MQSETSSATPMVAPPHASLDDMLAPAEASPVIGAAVATLSNWRQLGQGPKFHKIGKRMVRYRRGDVLDWLAAQVRQTADSLASKPDNAQETNHG